MRRTAAAALAAALVLTGCSSPEPRAERAGAEQTTLVLAAASLTGVFTTLGRQYEAAHPDRRVQFSFGSSATLATQIAEGAPADVFAAADETSATAVGEVGPLTRQIFATNTLQIAVPPDNPGLITGLGDFADTRRRLALCAPEVPCGRAASTLFAHAGITPAPDTYEPDVKATVAKVTSGEVDAALVYRTDVVAAKDQVIGIDAAGAETAVNRYPLLDLGRRPGQVNGFYSFVLSEPGQTALRTAGFGPP